MHKLLLEQLVNGNNLGVAQAETLMRTLASGDGDAIQSGAILAALRAKGETADELRGFALAMRDLAIAPEIDRDLGAIDSVGTGGDGSGSLNLSTGAALLAAACGQPVVKHGNRAVSSKCGSADVLEQLGMPLPADAESATRCLEYCGFTFLFAPYFHPAMKNIAPVRASLGIRTVFNLLGPLSNPAKPPYMLVGAWSARAAELIAAALADMPVERAFVVHGADGWDEATPVGPFHLFDVNGGGYSREMRNAAEYGLPKCRAEDLVGGDAAYNAQRIRQVFNGEDKGPHHDALCLATGLMLELRGDTASLQDGIAVAKAAIQRGDAQRQLAKLLEQEAA